METNNTTVTKVCKICNEEKDIKLFTYNNHSEDMHTNICIDCSKKNKNKNRVPIIRKSNDELSNYKSRELIDSLRDIIKELRDRGYVVDVSYSYKIKL